MQLFLSSFIRFNLAPVKILVCNVSNIVKLSDDEGENMTEHIVGTHMDDLTQIYNGKVIIKSSVDVTNIFSSANGQDMFFAESVQADYQAINSPIAPQPGNPNTKIIVNGMPFDLNVNQQYWMKNVNQVRIAYSIQ